MKIHVSSKFLFSEAIHIKAADFANLVTSHKVFHTLKLYTITKPLQIVTE